MKKILAALVAATTFVALAGCGSSSPGHNAADVSFASQMIPHHEQAVTMADMVPGKGASPEVTRLAARIKAAQAPEIRQLTRWLKTWDEKVPSDSMSGMSGMHHSMPGMMSDADMAKLQSLTGTAFDRQWLTMMIEHHEGALAMASTEQKDGTFTPAVGLAKKIQRSQTKQIAEMRTLLR